MPSPDVCTGELYNFLGTKPGNHLSGITHTNLTGGAHGKYNLSSSESMNAFRTLLAKALKEKGIIPCISEMRTQNFPFYVDLDLEVCVPKVSADAISMVSVILNTQVERFFPHLKDSEEKHLTLIVCTKYKPGNDDDEHTGITDAATMHKHGIHFHWPQVIVDIDQALQIRTSLIAALEFVQDWEPHFGSKELNWEKFVDEAVYRTGLRVVGAPKAKPCPICKGGSKHCGEGGCGRKNEFKIIDPSYYDFYRAFLGDEDHPKLNESLKTNKMDLVMKTSVRTDATKSQLYTVYPGCPLYIAQGGKQRKRKSDLSRLPSKLRKMEEISDPVTLSMVRELLVQHSDKYKDCHITVRVDEKREKCTVLLKGDGSTWCLNKGFDKDNPGDYHKSQHVYMVVQPIADRSNAFYSIMKCWCQCPTPRGGSEIPCKDIGFRIKKPAKTLAEHLRLKPPEVKEKRQ